jgi:ankyrin repeat protein
MDAAERGDMECVRRLIRAGAPVSAAAARGAGAVTALHAAAGNGHSAVVAALLAGGAEVDKPKVETGRYSSLA